MKLKQSGTWSGSNGNAGTTPQTMICGEVTMKDVEKKVKKEMKAHQKNHASSTLGGSPSNKEIEPPRFHRDIRLICDVFRISEQSRYALRNFDAATLDDFSLMTDEDYADMVVTQARIGHPLPPLQQRKLRVLLSWVQSLAKIENLESIPSAETQPPKKAEGFEVKESKGVNNDGILKASYKTTSSSPKKGGGTCIPSDWESRFYADLPRLRRELRQLGGESSNRISEFLSLRWILCGYDK